MLKKRDRRLKEQFINGINDDEITEIKELTEIKKCNKITSDQVFD